METQTSEQLQNRLGGAHLGGAPQSAKELLTLDFSIEELKTRNDGNISGGACSVSLPACGACSCAHPGD